MPWEKGSSGKALRENVIISSEFGILHDFCFTGGSLASSSVSSSSVWHHTVTLVSLRSELSGKEAWG